MAEFLERRQTSAPSAFTGGLTRRDEARTHRALSALESRTLMRLATVQAESMVQSEKLHEVDRLGRVAMTGHSMLIKWGDTLAAGDPLLRDELKFFTDVCRMGKGEIIADTIDTFRREGFR